MMVVRRIEFDLDLANIDTWEESQLKILSELLSKKIEQFEEMFEENSKNGNKPLYRGTVRSYKWAQYCLLEIERKMKECGYLELTEDDKIVW